MSSTRLIRTRSPNGLLLGALLTVVVMAVLLVLILILENLPFREFEQPLLLCLGIFLAIISLLPAFISMYVHGHGFDLFHPLLYAAYFFFIPEFVIVSFMLVLGQVTTSSALLLGDPALARIAAMKFAILGSIGLTLGYFLPVGRLLGRLLPTFKALDYPTTKLQISAVILLLLGLIAQVGAFRSGLFGYQSNQEIAIFGAAFAFFSQCMLVSHGVIWYSYFKEKRGWWLPSMLSIAVIILTALVSGSRAALILPLLIVVAGYQYAQDNFKPAKLWKWALLAVLALWIGIVFGTYFRSIKTELLGRTTSMSFSDVLLIANLTRLTIQKQPLLDLISFGWDWLPHRLDGITQLGVILNFADQFKAAERAIGIDNNIIKDMLNAFIPRFVWTSKPIVGGTEQIGNLYFNVSNYSPAVTYMGDLYRNFGVWGIAPGMLIIGVTLRVLYVWLVEKQSRSPLRISLFLVLAGVVNYEGMYSTYFPSLIRTFVVALTAIAIVTMLGRFSFSKTPTSGDP